MNLSWSGHVNLNCCSLTETMIASHCFTGIFFPHQGDAGFVRTTRHNVRWINFVFGDQDENQQVAFTLMVAGRRSGPTNRINHVS